MSPQSLRLSWFDAEGGANLQQFFEESGLDLETLRQVLKQKD